MKAMPGKVILKRDEFEHKVGDIHLPQGSFRSKEGSRFGTVVAIPECEPEMKVGDRVMFTKFAGNTVEIDGEDVYICDRKLILAIIG